MQGKIEAQGTPSSISRTCLDFAELMGSDETGENEESLERRMSRQFSTQMSTISNKEEIIDESTQGVGMEESSKGKVKGSIAIKYFRAGGNWFLVFTILLSFGLAQVLASVSDYWVSVW